MCHFLQAGRRLWKSSAGISTNLIPMSKTTFGTYHYPANTGRGRTTFPKVALGSLHESLAFLMEKVMAYKIRWLAVPQTYLSALFTFQRTTGLSAYENLLKPADFHRVANMEIGTGKREWTNHVPTMYLFNL